jgi:hypothetical protein
MPPDLIIIPKTIHDGARFRTDLQAVAIKGTRILAVGSEGQILSLQGPQTRLLRRPDALLIPAFSDAHMHLIQWALAQEQLDLSETASLQDLQQALRSALAQLEGQEWVLGQGWNETHWPRPLLPTRHDLDAVAGEAPVALWRSDMHLAVANTAALRRAAIDRNTPDPPHGVIDRGESGEPTGVLRERAIDLMRAVIPPPSPASAARALRRAIPQLHALGILCVHDARIMDGRFADLAFQVYPSLAAQSELPLRIWTMVALNQLDQAERSAWKTGQGDDLVRIGHLKLFSDGSQGSRTAWMLEPYLDTAQLGLPLMPLEEIRSLIVRAAQLGLAPAIHAIGDRAVREVIGLLRETLDEKTISALKAPPRIEHLQNIRPEDLPALAHSGAVASMQPIHLVDDMEMMERSVGARARYAYVFADLLGAPVPLAFGSDAPVADPNPLLGIQAAVTRQTPKGEPPQGWFPEQRLTLEQALSAYTLGPARACGLEAHLGRIAPAYLADLALIRPDLCNLPPGEIHNAQVVTLLFGGKVVYNRHCDNQ